MRGDFKLDGVYYKAAGGNLPSQTLANQMASKVGQGVSQYGDLTSWSAWIQDNTQEGVGNLNPAVNGGALYSEAETRVPNQIILRGLLKQVDTRTKTGVLADCQYNPTNMSGAFSLDATTTTKAAISFTTPGTLNSTTFYAHVWMRASYGAVLTLEVRNNNAGSPGGTVLTSSGGTYTTTFPGFAWNGYNLAFSGTLVAATQYWLCIGLTSGTAAIGYGVTGYNTDSKLLISGVWTTQTTKYMAYLTTAYQTVNAVGNNKGNGFFRFTSAADTLYMYSGNRIYKYNTVNDGWTLVGTIAGLNASHAQLLSKVYFADDTPATSNYYTMNAAETIAASAADGTAFADAGGYLWKAATGLDTGYTTDAVTYTSDINMRVGAYDRYIAGMCQFGESMFVSTCEALYRIAPGDFAVRVLKWGSCRMNNGRSMVNHGGALYVVADNRVYRFTEDLQRQDVWMSREDDLISTRLGPPVSICSCNSWLIVICSDNGASSKPTVWAYQDNHWHCIASLPDASVVGTDNNLINYACFYDSVTAMLWFLTPSGVTYRVYMPGTAINPYNDSTTVYSAAAWMEWDWFDSPVLEANKDYDSVSIIGENISSAQGVYVYWKDDASTDWEFLGTCTANYTELRWTLASLTRPSTKRFKLGLLLYTTTGASTPRIRAFRVKYHLMVRDWFRWRLAVDVSGRTGALQEVADGTRHTLTAAQIKTNLDTLVKQVPPFVYTDVDATQYEVKVTDANFNWTKHEYNELTADEWYEGVYSITIEQTTTGTYA